jgi:DNA-binding CsgD family transcriptional regulator
MPFHDIEKLIEEEAARLRAILSSMNRQEVATKVGLHRNTVYGFVKGNDVGLPVLRRLSDYVDGVQG